MKKTIDHPTRVLQECISALNGTLGFADFLSCFARVVQSGLEETKISEWWAENHNRIESDNPEVEFASFLKRVHVIGLGNAPSAKIQENSKSEPRVKELSEKLVDLIELAKDLEIEQLNKAHGEFSKYWAFKPAWPFHAILPQLFPEGDPAEIIASNLRAMFPSLRTSFGDEKAAATDYIRIIRNSRSHQLAIEIGEWVGLRTSAVVGDLFKYVLKDKSATPSDTSPADFLKAAVRRTHALFELVMDAWQSNPLGPRLTKGEELLILLNLPLSTKPDLAGPSHLTPSNLHILTCAHAIDVLFGDGWQDCLIAGQHSWDSFLKRYRDFRRRELDGRSPVDIETADSLRFGHESNWHLEEIETDFTIQLAECWNDYGMLVSWWDDDKVDPESRADKYISLFRQARDEGFFELANALLTFFLFSQSLVHQGRLGSDTAIYSAIKEGMALPGVSTLARGVDISAQIAEYKKNPIVATKLRQFVRASAIPPINDDLRLLGDATIHPSAANVEHWLVNRLTEERWSALAERSREALKNAQLAYVTFLQQRKDWGTVAVDYCKPFEYEIRQRYEGAYRAWDTEKRNAKHVDAVALVKMLIKYKSLPSSVRDKIDATGTTLHNKRKLLERIEHLLVDYRNVGAHPNEFPVDRLHKLHEALFTDEVLSKFIDSLRP